MEPSAAAAATPRSWVKRDFHIFLVKFVFERANTRSLTVTALKGQVDFIEIDFK